MLEALAQSAFLDNATILAPDSKYLHDLDNLCRSASIIPYRKKILPNSLLRAIECLFSHKKFQGYDAALVLGDMPLHKVSQQTVLVHQPHLILPSVNVYSSRRIKYMIARWLFKYNLKYVNKVIVQTGNMKNQLALSYSELQDQDRIVVMPQPAPTWLLNNKLDSKKILYDGQLRLFYPAAGYPHKNHCLIKEMQTVAGSKQSLVKELVVTLDKSEENILFPVVPWVKNVGRIGTDRCLKEYYAAQALFFPSLLESYGMPIVESMTLGLPVLCADLPYAHWLCEDQAIYFNPTDPSSAWLAIEELHNRLKSGWRVDWRKPLEKLPKDWKTVANQFFQAMGLVGDNEELMQVNQYCH